MKLFKGKKNLDSSWDQLDMNDKGNFLRELAKLDENQRKQKLNEFPPKTLQEMWKTAKKYTGTNLSGEFTGLEKDLDEIYKIKMKGPAPF